MRKQESHFQSYSFKIMIIILLSITIKLLLFSFFYHSNPTQLLRNDSPEYLSVAKGFLKTGLFVTTNHQFMFLRTPGYPLFIAFAFWLFGSHLSSIIISQILLSAVLIFCTYGIGSLLFSRQIGYYAALLIGFDYLLFTYSFVVLSDFLFAVVLSLALLFAIRLLLKPQHKASNAFLFGCFIAIATLIRPANYFLFIPIFIGITGYLIIQRLSIKHAILILCLLSFPSLILIGGWQIRNKIVLGTFQYSQIFAQKGISQLFPKNYQRYRKTNPTHFSHFGIKEDLQILFAYPTLTIKTMLQGMILLLFHPDKGIIQFFGNQNDILTFRKIKTDVLHFQFKKALTKFKRGIFKPFTLMYVFFALLITLSLYLFMLYGLYGCYQDDHFKNKLFAHILLIGVMGYFILISANAESYARFRLPFELIIIVYAAFGIHRLIKQRT